jgi:hypothetical protein
MSRMQARIGTPTRFQVRSLPVEFARSRLSQTDTGLMKTRMAVAALVALTALACGKKNETADTTTVPGVDTTAGKAMPTTDTIVKTTTTDTIQGEVPRDSVKKDTTSSKTKTKTKTP